MKTLTVIVEKSDTGFSAYLRDVDGVVATGATLDEVKVNMESGVNFHIEGLKEFGEEVPTELQGEYRFEYAIDFETLFGWLNNVITKSGVSKISGLNQSLVSQYAVGIKKPSPKQLRKVEKGLHEFGSMLQSIQFTNA